jgi:hypothetical protein
MKVDYQERIEATVSELKPTSRRCGLDFFISCESLEPKRFSVEIMGF